MLPNKESISQTPTNVNASEQLAALLQSLVQASGYVAPATAAASAVPDPSLITTYAAALQHTIAYVLPARTSDIRTLITTQTELERRCARERSELIEKQRTRARTRVHLDGVLRMVAGTSNNNTHSGNGTTAVGSHDGPSHEENQRELDQFDDRVYAQLERGARAAAAQLGDWGVPLFCVRPELVTEQVRADRMKMIQFLQDACQ
ncbi:hypothetical protein D0Z00_003165 [Geotrichum galactomycetum]|uniref:Uncharacterized protein n=1 Tax=Geotrichum galactomycetum TaxID=27317 RepID=A0ACB6V231_9ASCO|nr:hypothetical protein D0Z00_003165 [Geotrichum candidum]